MGFSPHHRLAGSACRWARNLDGYKAAELQRFTSYYGQVAPEASVMLTRATRTLD
jgi:hypothetical protein